MNIGYPLFLEIWDKFKDFGKINKKYFNKLILLK
jgi:hypothetical protein